MEKAGLEPESVTISDTLQKTTKSEDTLPECDLSFADQCKIVWEGIKRGYKYDGCTAAPDFDFGADCCGEHDYHYQAKQLTRAEADKKLRECLRKKGYFVLPWIYWLVVRTAGWAFWHRRPKIPVVQVEDDRPILPQ